MTWLLLTLTLVPALILPTATASPADHGTVRLIVSLAGGGAEHPVGAMLITVSNRHDVPVRYSLRAAAVDSTATDVLDAVVRDDSDEAVVYRGPLSKLTVDSDVAIAPGTAVTYVVVTQWASSAEVQSAPASLSFVADGWAE